MKKNLGQIIILIFATVFFYGCKEESESKAKIATRTIIHFPHIEPVSVRRNGNELIMEFVDSKPMYNEVVTKQATLVYALQKESDSIDYSKVTFKTKMPNRGNSVVEYSLTKSEFEKIQKKFSAPKYKAFLLDLLELNWNTKKHYNQKFMSLLDRTNMIFAHEINKNYKDLFPKNSTWFGFDSFTVFGAYFEEVVHEKKGIAHNLINSIKSSEGYLTERDKTKLLQIIDKHVKRFKKA